VVGATEEAAEEALDDAHAELVRAKRDGLVESFVPLGALVRSGRAQRASLAASSAALPALHEALRTEGFRAELFGPHDEAIADANAPPLTLAAILASPLGDVVRPLAPRIDGQQAFVVPLGGVRSMTALRTQVPHAVIVDERALLEETYGHVRRRVTSMLGLGLVFVTFILFMRYKRARLVLASALPALLATACVVAGFGWAGEPMTIMHTIGLSLVLSMGVDYGIFVVEATNAEDAARSLVSVFTATTTTLLSFGLLALSANPALRAIGLTISLGLTGSFLLCPVSVAFLDLGARK
jgi:predicted exporter